MTREDFLTRLFASQLFQRWHWFRWHFEHILRGESQPFADAVIEACLACERRVAGFAAQFIDDLASIGGRERDQLQYEQLIGKLAELHILRRLVDCPEIENIHLEPGRVGGLRNPEYSFTIGAR